MLTVQLIKSRWEEQFYKVVEAARSDLLVASPFIKRSQATSVISRLTRMGVSTTIQVNIITDLKPDNILTGSLDIDALLAFTDSLPNSTVTYLPNLHAKIYVADDHTAVITSANLTSGGLRKNFEYGALITDPVTVASVRQDFRQYASLGALVSKQTLKFLANTAADLKDLRQQSERGIQQKFRTAFNQKLAAANHELLLVRAEGKTTRRIFAETILYLLDQGPLRTVDLHPLIQQLHPDLCNNDEDRVIKGVHFGKKWKHYVRTAQVYLRRRGLIYLEGKYWQKAHSGTDI